MRNILIFHGTGGSPEGNWFPWLKEELESRGHRVFIPKFPDPRKDNHLEDWLKVLEAYKEYINESTILIGHSLGGLFLLRVLERLEKKVAAAFFISPPAGVKPIKYFVSDEKFSGFEFDWEKIRKGAKYFKVYHSDNDPYISLANGQKVADELEVSLAFIPNAGHLNAEAGFTEFPQLLEDIRAVL